MSVPEDEERLLPLAQRWPRASKFLLSGCAATVAELGTRPPPPGPPPRLVEVPRWGWGVRAPAGGFGPPGCAARSVAPSSCTPAWPLWQGGDKAGFATTRHWRSLRSFPSNSVSLRGVLLCLNVYAWKLQELSFLYRNHFPICEDDLLKTQSTLHPY